MGKKRSEINLPTPSNKLTAQAINTQTLLVSSELVSSEKDFLKKIG